MKEKKLIRNKILSAILSLTMLAASLPTNLTFAKEDNAKEFKLDNGYITAVVSEENGGFMIRTADGDAINKDDNDKNLLYHSELDDTSFTSFRVTRNGVSKDYIFGGEYEGSSKVSVSQGNNEITAVWSVDGIVFTQSVRLVNSGSNEHGMVYISYQAHNEGAPAQIQARVLLDTALGTQDYAYYRVGGNTIETETTLDSNGYDKTFYAYDDPYDPKIVAYVVNASVADTECKPYQTQLAHWANLASTVFDYETDKELTFSNPNNKKHLTADSAAAFYYDLGTVAQGTDNTVALNYGVFSHETVDAGTQATFDVTAPDALELTEDGLSYKDNGLFSIVSNVKNISEKKYERVKIVVQTTKGITPIDYEGNEVEATYDHPYTYEWVDFMPSQTQETTWKFKASPEAEGVYGRISFKIYDVSDESTMNTNEIMTENLLGEGRTYILLPGSVTKVPAIKFTGASPETLYVEGERTFNITGANFSMLADKSAYKLIVSRVDGMEWNGMKSFEISSDSFSVDELNNTITVKMDDSMPRLAEGQYQLTFDYTASDKEDLTSVVLRFMAKDDTKYKNDTYGLLAVVKDDSNKTDIRYTVQKFADEAAYNNYLGAGDNRDKVLLEFRGKFTLKSENGVNVYTALSKDGTDNVVTLNSCLDIEKGTTVVTENKGSVVVDFDANIYTTGSRTSVFQGVCGLTELERGENYNLIVYDEDGEREEEAGEAITLLWPSVGQAAQNLLGMLFDFKYGELGVIKSDDAETRVIAFGASLDLSFTIPDSADTKEEKPTALASAMNEVAKKPGYSANDVRKVNKSIPYNSNTSKRVNQTGTNTGSNAGAASNNVANKNDDDDDDDDGFSGSVEISDILFGGKYIGVNFEVEIGVPSLVNGMPQLEGTLAINTVGDWSVGVDGTCEFTSFVLEAGISIKSKNNIPVPDSLHFFLGGFVPGVNVDGFGVLWLQGAGGGIENLYDTIFIKDAVPPLKLIIEAQFSLMQVISARAKLELGLQGIGVELSEGKVANYLTVLEQARLQFDWYPEFYFMSSAYLNIEDIVKGGGYIVVEQNGFFEFFIKASVGIPDDIPLVGGIELASVGLGVNLEKIWGQVKVLFIDLGIVYYWGGDFGWGGGAGAEPTYPDLLADAGGIGKDIPVYQDEENGRTLYARVGTNLTKKAAEVVSQDQWVSSELYTAGTSKKAATYSKNVLQTNLEGSKYVLTLAPKQKNEMVSVEWNAQSMEAAKKQVETFAISNSIQDSDVYKLTLLDHNKDASAQKANANLTYDSETGRATLCITFTEEKDFNKQWNLQFGQLDDIQVTLYDVEEMPTLSQEDTKLELDKTNNSKATLTIGGSRLKEFKSISVFAAKKKENTNLQKLYEKNSLQSLFTQAGQKLADTKQTELLKTTAETTETEGLLLYYEEREQGFAAGDVLTFELPEALESGDYEIQIVAKDDQERYNASADLEMTYVNKNTPKAAKALSELKNAGDYQVQISVQAPLEGSFDGYSVTVYDENGKTVSGLEELMFYPDGNSISYNEDGTISSSSVSAKNAVLKVGGQYSYTDEQSGEQKVIGLEAGKSYQLGVCTWKQTAGGSILRSEEKKSTLVTVKKPVETKITCKADKNAVIAKEERTTAAGETITFETPMYADNVLTITAEADSEITGSWKLDNGTLKEQTGVFEQPSESVKIPLTNLTDGQHLLTIRGENANGDAFEEVYSFGVDTVAPRMLLSSPVSGTVYSDGMLEITGITDADARLTVVDATTQKVLVDKEAVTVDAEGRFTTAISMDESVAFHKLTIQVSDELGNIAQKQVDVLSGKLGKLDALALYADGRDVTNQKLAANKSYTLTLMGRTTDGNTIEINAPSLVEWDEITMEGNASLEQSQDQVVLTTSADSCGMVTARYLVNSAGAYSVSAVFGADTAGNEPDVNQTPTPTPDSSQGAGEDGSGSASEASKDTKKDTSRKANSAKTGDEADFVLPLCMLLVSGGVVAVLLVKTRRRKNKRSEA